MDERLHDAAMPCRTVAISREDGAVLRDSGTADVNHRAVAEHFLTACLQLGLLQQARARVAATSPAPRQGRG